MSSLRIASFNVQNLLHPGVRFARDEGKPKQPQYDEAMYADKVRWIGGILDEGEVDLVGFQELFSRTSIEDALAHSKRLAGAEIIAPDLEDNIKPGADGKLQATGPFVGLATTMKVLHKHRITEFPQNVIDALAIRPDGHDGDPVKLPLRSFQRPVLRVDVELPNGAKATVFVAHLKSKLGQFLPGENEDDFRVMALGAMRSLIVRAAESVALRELVLEQARKTAGPVIVIGDLNDDLAAVSTQTIAGPQPFRFAKAPEKELFFDVLLHSVHDIQDREVLRDLAYSHIFEGRYQLLDHIFVSREFIRENPKRIGEVRNTRIFNDHLVDEGLAVNVKSGLSARSDHGVVVAEFSLQKLPAPGP